MQLSNLESEESKLNVTQNTMSPSMIILTRQRLVSVLYSKIHPMFRREFKYPLLTMALCRPNESHTKENAKVDFGAMKDHGSRWVFRKS